MLKPKTFDGEMCMICIKCKELKPFIPKYFPYRSSKADGKLRPICRPCRGAKRREDPIKCMYLKAKSRAKSKELEFTIQLEDITIPKKCPIRGVKFSEYKYKSDSIADRPSLDRIDSSKGYIPGNVQVISMKANELKSDATFKEIEQLYNFMLHNKIK